MAVANTPIAARSKDAKTAQCTELLVRFENCRTYHLDVPWRLTQKHYVCSNGSVNKGHVDGNVAAFVKREIIYKLFGYNNYPEDCLLLCLQHLELTHFDPPFCNIRFKSQIRGGKGGFGTLLKGQSRQASAHTTKDFSMCRDLQGRRLRHVNDAVHYAIWKEWKDKVDAGTATEEEMAQALATTDSGIAGWHLQLPAWAEVSTKKEQQRTKLLLRKWKKEREMAKAYVERQREMQERHIASYVQAADAVSAKLESTISAALQQGLQRKQEEKQQQQAAKRQKIDAEPPAALLTLSGDVVLLQENDIWHIQSNSNFCTVGIVLDKDKVRSYGDSVFYWEISMKTGGIVQVGWASASFRPNSENGDGVGDCQYSWGYDGNRSIKLHNEITEPYGGESWKEGDVIGCCYDKQTSSISFYRNGDALGTAFVLSHPPDSLFPAISCNPGEVVGLRVFQQELEYQPTGSVSIGDVLALEDVSLDNLLSMEDADGDKSADETTGTSLDEGAASEQKAIADTTPAERQSSDFKVEPLELEKFDSVEQLEALGLDRLKGALMALELKCGGSLRERAERLFAVRGLRPTDYPPKLLAKKQK
jgi:hypothetical protein